MSHPFAASFSIIKEGNIVVVEDVKGIEIPRPDGPHLKDVLDPYEVERNIECIEEVEALEDGEYYCLLAGTWGYEITYDAEGNKDAELMIDHLLIEIQKKETK